MSVALQKYQLNRPALSTITSDTQNQVYSAALLDIERQKHSSKDDKEYAQNLAMLIENYEKVKYSIPSASPQQVLVHLIEANNLRQKDLAPLLGSESIVSEVLNGKRELNKHHIEKLSQRFGVSPAVFF